MAYKLKYKNSAFPFKATEETEPKPEIKTTAATTQTKQDDVVVKGMMSRLSKLDLSGPKKGLFSSQETPQQPKYEFYKKLPSKIKSGIDTSVLGSVNIKSQHGKLSPELFAAVDLSKAFKPTTTKSGSKISITGSKILAPKSNITKLGIKEKYPSGYYHGLAFTKGSFKETDEEGKTETIKSKIKPSVEFGVKKENIDASIKLKKGGISGNLKWFFGRKKKKRK